MTRFSPKPLVLILALIVICLTVVTYRIKQPQVSGVSTTNTKIRGLILPHHALAGGLISEALNKLKDTVNYSEIVIIGPNHFYPDSYGVTSTLNLNQTALDQDIILKLADQIKPFFLDEQIVSREHSITLPLSYLQKYYPAAQVIPIIVSPKISRSELENIAQFLTTNLPENTLYVLSIDFAHNLMSEPALINNRKSIEAISHFDLETIYNFDDHHLDSPKATGLFLEVMQNLKALDWQTWQSAHSALIVNDPAVQGTSYVIGVFNQTD